MTVDLSVRFDLLKSRLNPHTVAIYRGNIEDTTISLRLREGLKEGLTRCEKLTDGCMIIEDEFKLRLSFVIWGFSGLW